jgi:hypothetical protein
MQRRSVVKAIVVLAAAVIGVVGVAVIGVVGYFFYHLAVPERMDVTGRVTDSSGRAIEGIEVHAVPLPIADPYSDGAIEPKGRERTTVTDKSGRYRFEGLVASVGVKEGRCMQGYDIAARGEGCSPQVIRVCKHPDDRRDVIKLADFVLE